MPSLATDETELLFWKDPYLTEFEAKITAITEHGIVLDKTIFYPIGGGQFSDNGIITLKSDEKLQCKINSIEKIDGKIVHIIKKKELKKLEISDVITGKINWKRRYKLMKAHSSQHILSAMIVKYAKTETEKAVIDEVGVSIYLEKNISQEQLKKSLVETNKILNSDLAIISKIVTKEEIPKSLEKKLRGHLEEVTSSKIRIVSIGGVDDSLCGGTHCKNTSEIGPIILTDFKGDIISYVFGETAIETSAELSLGAIKTAKMLAAKPVEVFDRIVKTIDEYKEMKEINYQLTKSVVKAQMIELKKTPEKIGHLKIFSSNFSFAEKKFVLQELGELPVESLAIFIVKGPILLITSNSKQYPANNLIKLFSQQTSNKGGGSPIVAQSSVREPEKALKILAEIIKNLE